MQHLFFIIVLIVICTSNSADASQKATWQQMNEDLAEYQLLSSHTADVVIQCLTYGRVGGADTVAFWKESRTCNLYECNKGDGCRKCRNLRNSSLPRVWVKLQESRIRCWKTFQHRVDGSVSFNRNWSQYLEAFGQGEDLNFWIGLETLHQLTKDEGRRVRWEFSDWDGIWYWSENANFSIAGSADKFRATMNQVDTSKSNVEQITTTSTWSINSRMFSTPDADNDEKPPHCAKERNAGWWYGYCTSFNPNGVYLEPPDALNTGSIVYLYVGSSYPLVSYYSMRSFECLLEFYL